MYQQFAASTSTDYGQTIIGAPLADWASELVHLAKTAELKKHSLTLQLHTAHIVSAHATLEQKDKAIQNIREQKNKLDSDRICLLNCLAEINADRDKVDLMEASLAREYAFHMSMCLNYANKWLQLQEGDYATAKRDVDRLRVELGQPPLPPLQTTLDEKTSQYLRERRINGEKRITSDTPPDVQPGTAKRPRGRPKGSKNRGSKASGGSSATSGGGA
ncbi:hypothetical protein BKA83DRAFT_4162296 [Pisolithus microcarpus]|nr:hypothetical protein BKA83DRAFT_4162296 [Pisolithus microcarpus]